MSLRWPNPFSSQASYAIPLATPLRELRFVILDTELTSLNPHDNRLLSLGAIAMTGTKIHLGEQFYRLVNPGIPVPSDTVVVHKLRSNDVARGETANEVLTAFQKFSEGAILVGHFVRIDLNAIRKELAIEKRDFAQNAIDTVRVHRWIVSRTKCAEDVGHAHEKLDLSSLSAVYGLDIHDTHHALEDAFLTARLWQKLLCSIEKLGVRDLDSLLRIGST